MHHIDHADLEGTDRMQMPDADERYRPADRRSGKTLSDAEELEEKLEEERKRRDLPIQSRPLWLRCVLNVTMLRMCDEVYWAFLAWHHGRVAVFSARFGPAISCVVPRKKISRVVPRLFFF